MALSASAMVTLIDEKIETIITGKLRSWSVGNKTFTAHNLDELKELREYYASIAASEDRASGDYRPFKMYGARLGRPS